MNQHTISYGLIPPQSPRNHDMHILPILKIMHLENGFLLTCGRDGCLVKHCYNEISTKYQKRIRMQVNSDWACDMVHIGDGRFLTVSHDFSVNYVVFQDCNDSWSAVKLGYHDDYIKCVALLPSLRGSVDSSKSNYESDGSLLAVQEEEGGEEEQEEPVRFATAGLDKKVKFWSLSGDKAMLVCQYDNAQPHETGSIYVLCALSPYQVIIGDNNGDLKLISALNGELLYTLPKAHDSNIKLAQLFDDGRFLITTSSDSCIKLWDVSALRAGLLASALIYRWDWHCAVWSFASCSSDQFILGDASGTLTSVRRQPCSGTPQHYTSGWAHAKQKVLYNTVAAGSGGGILAISLDPRGDKLWFSSSANSNLYLLNLDRPNITNVSTIEGGSALLKSCLLTNRRHVITLNTLGQVQKWDIVSCKLLDTFEPEIGSFDELVTKNNTKEVLSHWCSVSIKTGMLFVIFNERFVSTEVYGTALKEYKIVNGVDINDDQCYNLGRIALNSILHDFIRYETKMDKLVRTEVAGPRRPLQTLSSNMVPDGNGSYSGSTNGAGTGSSMASFPGPLSATESKGKERKRLALFTKLSTTSSSTVNTSGNITPTSEPATPVSDLRYLANNGGSRLHIEQQQQQAENLVLASPATAPHLSSNCNGHIKPLGPPPSTAPEIGSRSNSSSASLLSWRFRKQQAISRPSTANVNCTESSLPQHDNSTVDNQANMSASNNVTIRGSPPPRKRPGATAEATTTRPTNIAYMCDYLNSLRELYQQQIASKSSFKKFGRKIPDTLFVRDTDAPIVEITTGCLLLVNYWRTGSCGPTVLFSTLIPPPNYDWDLDDFDVDNDDGAINDLKQIDRIHRYQLFQSLEQNLPHWFAKLVFKEEKVLLSYPKLSFIIIPWTDDLSTAKSTPNNSKDEKPRTSYSIFHKRTSDPPQALSQIVENKLCLNAPDMTKVKRIKQYIVDRFESKTPEMKNKISASEWLELLCKGSVLDNEMTLNTIRTLYWKSNTDITLEFRRKKYTDNNKPQ
ncbi:Duf1p Ecym_5334 [Eremothecium cymbalariae DBVPG|uniref:Uncharacterized protein n=1 Tax=Eremothecium cymbalariae (strain CBS 270.75 / DBVPG 7215 / KCTC 17166 / NRRL Y-17582) TaxID=931890 RepID=I6NDF1_ERECY|nr:hypothetical protein Ecym_5334 [Eremothecium cymbalariae DBVPG\